MLKSLNEVKVTRILFSCLFETKAYNQSHFTSVSALYTPLLQCTTSLKIQYCQQWEADQPILVYITLNFKGTVGRFCSFTRKLEVALLVCKYVFQQSMHCHKLKIKQLKMHRCERRFFFGSRHLPHRLYFRGRGSASCVYICGHIHSTPAAEANVSLGATIDQTCDFVSFTKEVKTH